MALFHPTVSERGALHEELYSDGCEKGANSVRAEEDEPSSPSTSPSPSPPLHRTLLDKPLEQLTEEDILHLTREDCRRYLKLKGMRRPSWNKSQAIQQVLSLKGLFDGKGDEEKSFRPLPCLKRLNSESPFVGGGMESEQMALYALQPSRVSFSQHISSTKSVGNEASSNSCKASEREGRKEVHAMHEPGDSQPTTCPGPDVSVVYNHLPRNSSAAMCPMEQVTQKIHFQGAQQLSSSREVEQSAQLTIFYAGMVNVFDEVPEDKARAILLLAAQSMLPRPPLPCSLVRNIVNSTMSTHGSSVMPLYVHSTIATTELCSTTASPAASASIAEHTTANPSENQLSRKACLQRYLEKRRGRYGVRNPYSIPLKRADSESLSSRPMAERCNFGSFLEMVAPSFALDCNPSQVLLPTQIASEGSSLPTLWSCSTL